MRRVAHTVEKIMRFTGSLSRHPGVSSRLQAAGSGALFRDLTIIETPDGFIVKGGTILSSEGGVGFTPQSYLFTDSDLEHLLEQALERRGSGATVEGTLPSVMIDGEKLRYEDALRSIGLLVDKIGWREIVLIQTSAGFHLKGVLRDEPIDRMIDVHGLRGLVEDMRQGREPRDAPRRKFLPR